MSVARSIASIVDVVAAVIVDAEGRLLLSRRPEGKHLAGLWEFPGGKREARESPEEALARELREELGIEIAASQPLMSLTHHYPEKSVRLLIHRVDDFEGQATGREGQRIDWFSKQAARALPMPPADRPILQLLGVHPCWGVIGPTSGTRTATSLMQTWQSYLDAGYGCVCLRSGGWQRRGLENLVQRCADRARRAGARWLIDAPVDAPIDQALEHALRFDADGIVISAGDLDGNTTRPLPSDRLLVVRCAGPSDLARAARFGADLACLTPPGTASAFDGPLLSEQIERSPLPVLVWGVAAGELDRARACGAFGVAVTDPEPHAGAQP